MVNQSALVLHLKILGPRGLYCLVSKNHKTDQVETMWLSKLEIFSYVEARNKEGYTCWISLDDKEKGNDTIQGVKVLGVLWFDVDSNRLDKSKPAAKEQLRKALEKAVELKQYVEKRFNAWGYIAYSGNGYHIFFPLPFFSLPGEKFREDINAKVSEFAKRVAANCGVEIDYTYDIRRVTTVIGSLNLKIPDQPLQTSWAKEVFENGLEYALEKVDESRKANQPLLEAVLKIEIAKLTPSTIADGEHPEFEELLEHDEKLKALYNGAWRKFGYPTRSEAEEALLVKLVQYGFSDVEILQIMRGSQIGKWHERPGSYRSRSLETARRFVATKKAEAKKTASRRFERLVARL